jgi:hypothetical protein
LDISAVAPPPRIDPAELAEYAAIRVRLPEFIPSARQLTKIVEVGDQSASESAYAVLQSVHNQPFVDGQYCAQPTACSQSTPKTIARGVSFEFIRDDNEVAYTGRSRQHGRPEAMTYERVMSCVLPSHTRILSTRLSLCDRSSTYVRIKSLSVFNSSDRIA